MVCMWYLYISYIIWVDLYGTYKYICTSLCHGYMFMDKIDFGTSGIPSTVQHVFIDLQLICTLLSGVLSISPSSEAYLCWLASKWTTFLNSCMHVVFTIIPLLRRFNSSTKTFAFVNWTIYPNNKGENVQQMFKTTVCSCSEKNTDLRIQQKALAFLRSSPDTLKRSLEVSNIVQKWIECNLSLSFITVSILSILSLTNWIKIESNNDGWIGSQFIA